MAKIPARYIGEHTLKLGSYGGPYYDGEGNLRDSLLLHTGDTLMMEEHEIRGDTYLFDPRGEAPTQFLGTGRVVKPEHAGLRDAELAQVGYQFCAGRPDFQEIVPGAPGSPRGGVSAYVAQNTAFVENAAPALSDVQIEASAPVDVQESEEQSSEA
ncbi:MAG TPA: hypothetical protein VFA10_17765 [Ktedonobacteraceae bacterium]|nr:hypothetical protein [Ktedonobacteraceae bacterium]